MEEFLVTSNLHLMNVATDTPTFESPTGSNWIDLTLCKSVLARLVRDWTCGEEESYSDHNIILFSIMTDKTEHVTTNYASKRYVIKRENCEKFDDGLVKDVLKDFHFVNSRSELNKCDNELRNLAKTSVDRQHLISVSIFCVSNACNSAFQKLTFDAES